MDAHHRARVKYDIQQVQLSSQRLRKLMKETGHLCDKTTTKRIQVLLDEGNATIWFALQELLKS